MGPAHGQVVTLPGRRWVWGRKKLGQNPFPMRGPPSRGTGSPSLSPRAAHGVTCDLGSGAGWGSASSPAGSRRAHEPRAWPSSARTCVAGGVPGSGAPSCASEVGTFSLQEWPTPGDWGVLLPGCT